MVNNNLENKNIIGKGLDLVHSGLIKVYGEIINQEFWRTIKIQDKNRSLKIFDKFEKFENCDIQACFKLIVHDSNFRERIRKTFGISSHYLDLIREGIQIRNTFSHPDSTGVEFTDEFTFDSLRTLLNILKPYKSKIEEFKTLEKFTSNSIKEQIIKVYKVDDLLNKYFPSFNKNELVLAAVQCKLDLFNNNENIKILDFAKTIDDIYEYLSKLPKKGPRLMSKYPNLPSLIVGRDNDVLEIQNLFKNRNIVVIQGLGGMGKSYLALNFIKERKNSYQEVQHLFFQDSIRNTINSLEFSGLDESDLDENEKYNTRISILTKIKDKSLIIIDNLDSPFNEFDFNSLKELENINCDILITSRFKELFTGFNIYQISKIDQEKQLSLFLEHFKIKLDDDQKNKIKEILTIIEGHTFLIEIIAKTMLNSDMTPDEIKGYLVLENTSNITELVTVEKDKYNYQQSLDEFVERLFDISKLDSESLRIMKILSLVPLEGVSRKRFRVLSGLENNNIINKLLGTGWIQDTIADGQTKIRLHPIITRLIIAKKIIHFSDYYNTLIELKLFFNAQDISIIEKKEWFNFASNIAKNVVIDNLNNLHILDDIAKIIWNLNAYRIAENIFTRIIYFLNAYNIDNPTFEYSVLMNIAFLNARLVNYEKSIDFYNKSIKVAEKDSLLSISHSYNELANIHRKRSDYRTALQEYSNALNLSKNDIEIAEAYNGLGVVYLNMRDYDKAIEYYTKALEIRQKNIYESKKNLAYSYNNIGTAYQRIGKFAEAYDNHKKAYDFRVEIFSLNHPDVAASLNQLGMDLLGLNSQECIKYFNQALNIRKDLLGENHPDIAWTYYSLAIANRKLFKDNKLALDYIKKVLIIREKTIGEKHIYYIESLIEISLIYIELGKISESYDAIQLAETLALNNSNTPDSILSEIESITKRVKAT
jgi:tetratricopeptide (TPR) repeat protein